MRTLMGVVRLVNADANRFYDGERDRLHRDYCLAVDARFGRVATKPRKQSFEERVRERLAKGGRR
ncbi:hypothetical protein QZM38_13840 [Burkholderia orbicola]|uniref:hypothetical protein n=1 Tax=Burkholderia orbicola TaxID=2978683 RepID=UPI00264E70DD|nr:hypothetical protein [Burkholderia orbicola]MDN7481907.1 hypothetical protein [Burkholderia orbicola]